MYLDHLRLICSLLQVTVGTYGDRETRQGETEIREEMLYRPHFQALYISVVDGSLLTADFQ